MARALALVANGLAASMAAAAFERDGVSLDDVMMISGRRLAHDWVHRCGSYIQFEKPASLSLPGQLKTLGFYARAVPALKRALADPALEHIYLVNVENILASHVLHFAETAPGVTLTVLAEGNMNYQPIGPQHRTWWRWWLRPLAARAMGLAYRKPAGHLSGAFEPRVDRVIAYSAAHLQAPPGKIEIIAFPAVTPRVTPDPDTVLVVATALNYFMSARDYARFKAAFARWIATLGASRVLVKLHPNYDTAGIEDAIEGAEIYDEPRGIETVAAEIPAARVVGYWSTGLVTLRLLRPDLEVIDFGDDFYAGAAFHGDASIPQVLEAAGIIRVAAAPFMAKA